MAFGDDVLHYIVPILALRQFDGHLEELFEDELAFELIFVGLEVLLDNPAPEHMEG